MGIDCYRVLFPKGMDANQYGCEVKPDEESRGDAELGPVARQRKPPAVVPVVVRLPIRRRGRPNRSQQLRKA